MSQTSNTPTSPGTLTSADAVREAFMSFFTARAHRFVPSSTTCPTNDPSLRDTFANAGMNQFKPIFQGTLPPDSPLTGVKRAVNSQKCIRAGGKHNDLDDVGRDTYHHTFFEMLGNWSFGDFFKAEIIPWAWEFLTTPLESGGMGLDPERLYATYFGGDEKQGLEPDDEARQLWLEHLPEDRVLPGDMKDNFWEMGDTGPCGPCSELHYDSRDSTTNPTGRELVNQDDPDVIELWNLVFIQFDRQESGELRTLPDKHVDTGMGLERIVRTVQGQRSNYDTDVFIPIFDAIQKATDARAYTGKLGTEDADGVDEAYRVIADHIRTLTIAITDGQMPSNESRGYVLRRILRRAVRYGRQKLGAPEGFFASLVPTVIASLGGAFPELTKDPANVQAIIAEEEASFGRTLDRGIKMFDGLASGGSTITGEDAFQLYDTYGFPFDLTEIMAQERGMTVDRTGFERCMEEAKERSRQGGRKGDGTKAIELRAEHTARLLGMDIKPTDDSFKFAPREISAHVVAIFNGDNFDEVANAASSSARVGVILDRTNFYAEMGGQVADTGDLTVSRDLGKDGGGSFKVEETRAFGGFVLHIGQVTKGEIRVGEQVACRIDKPRRERIAANHTTTHVLNLALRQTIGGSVDQRGSLVDPDRLRFDFTHSKPVTPDELGKVESIVRDHIERDLTVYADLAPLETAKSIHGLRAVFDETYPDPVRVVSVGTPVSDLLANTGNEAWGGASVEFCGGTHLESTGQAQAFALTSEEGIAKGIRRISALTGVPALAAIQAADNLEAEVDALASASGQELVQGAKDLGAKTDELAISAARKAQIRSKLGVLQDTIKKAAKAAAAEQAARAGEMAAKIGQAEAESPDEMVVATIELGSDRAALTGAVNAIQAACPNKAVIVLSPDEGAGRVALMASVPKPLIQRGLKAGDWIRTVAGVLGGKGGGKPDSAQGSGSDLSKLDEASKEAKAFAARQIS